MASFGPPAVDFYSMLSGLGDTLQSNAALKAKQQLNQNRAAAFSDFTALDPRAPDYGHQALTIAQKLGQAGDQDGAMKFIGLAQTAAERAQAQANTDRSFNFQTGQAAQSQKNADRSFGLQERAATRADEDKFAIKEITNPDGSTSMVRIKTTGPEGPISTGTAPAASPTNPFSTGGKFNADQAKAAGFTDRMLQSEGILSGVGGQPGVQDQGTSALQAGLSKIPVVGNYAISGDRQKYEQAKRDFVNAQLRRESGAAISQGEFDSAEKQYFPVPGDSADTIKQKTANRRAAVESMGREGGQSYRPKFSFDEGGALQPMKQAPITQQQYAALPPGSPYMAPDGSMRVKK